MDSQHRVQSYTSVFSSHNQTMWTKRKSDLFTFNFHVFLPGPVDSLLWPIVFLRSSFFFILLLACYDLVLTHAYVIGKTELNFLATVPAEESIDSFNVWSQDGLLSLFVVGEERGRRSACECVRLSPGVPCLVSGSLNSSFSSEMGPGAPLFPWSQRLSAL